MTLNNTPSTSVNLKLRTFLSDAELNELERYSSAYKTFGKTCPTCEDRGAFYYQGAIYPCATDSLGRHEDHRLFMTYCLANIPYEFMVLDWDGYPHEKLKKEVDFWVENYSRVRRTGIGFEISGPHGTGKTWAAVHALMEIVKQGYTGWFIQFSELKGLYEREEDEKSFKLNKIRTSEVLVIDDIQKPWSPAMRDFYEEKMEDALRERSHNNLPTITTSNLTPAKWKEYYPRVYAQLSGKQLRHTVEGEDYRPRSLDERMKLAVKGEARPIV